MITIIVTTKAKSIKVVCNVSVITMVFTPPLYVYNRIISKITNTVTANGIPNESTIKDLP